MDQGLALQSAAARLSDGHATIAGADFTAGLIHCYDDLAVEGANPNPVFLGMMAAAQLERLGYSRPELSTHWRAANLSSNASATRTATRAVSGAAATVPWILRGLSKNRGSS